MDLSFLIPSKMRRQVLAYFVANPETQVGIRELARELKAPPQAVYRELLNMEGWGFLFSSKRGNQRAFRLNRRFFLLPPIQELFRRLDEEKNRKFTIVKTYNLEKEVKRLRKIPVPPELIPGLTSKRRRPRAYAEEKSLAKLRNR
ncbi:MAG: hypothetical protein IT573_01130 [Deltaproteobacteria bacterium]|nr:hypothetical protein [Deltaproteobacteria bacterium]